MNLKYHNWNEIPIKIYYKIVDIIKQNEETPDKQIIPLLSLLFGETEENIGKLKIVDVKSLMSKVSWINQFKYDKKNRPLDITVNGIKSNKIKYDLSAFSYKAFIDFQDAQKNMEQDITYLPNVLATFITPEGKEYDTDYNMQDWIDTIEEYLPITTAQSLMYFFLKDCKSLLETTVESSIQIMKKMEKKKQMMTQK